MNKERFKAVCDRIREAQESGETDTRLGKVLARWKDQEIAIWRDGRWLLEGFIMEFKKQREILSAIDPSISPVLPPHLLDPVQIARFWNIPVNEFNWSDPAGRTELATALLRIEGKLDRSLSDRQTGQQEAGYVSMKQAAALTSVSYSHVRRAVLSGELPSSNVGSASHPAYRIARTDLTAWMQKKKGKTSNVPPQSDLADLIHRHLPGLQGRKDSATR